MKVYLKHAFVVVIDKSKKTLEVRSRKHASRVRVVIVPEVKYENLMLCYEKFRAWPGSIRREKIYGCGLVDLGPSPGGPRTYLHVGSDVFAFETDDVIAGVDGGFGSGDGGSYIKAVGQQNTYHFWHMEHCYIPNETLEAMAIEDREAFDAHPFDDTVVQMTRKLRYSGPVMASHFLHGWEGMEIGKTRFDPDHETDVDNEFVDCFIDESNKTIELRLQRVYTRGNACDMVIVPPRKYERIEYDVVDVGGGEYLYIGHREIFSFFCPDARWNLEAMRAMRSLPGDVKRSVLLRGDDTGDLLREDAHEFLGNGNPRASWDVVKKQATRHGPVRISFRGKRETSVASIWKTKRTSHFAGFIDLLQTNAVDRVLVEAVSSQLKGRDITPKTVRDALDKLGLRKHDSVYAIYYNLNDMRPPVFEFQVKDTLVSMFKQVHDSFVEIRRENPRCFLSYPYVLYKLCELSGRDLHFLMSGSKAHVQDQTFELVCVTLGWPFHPTGRQLRYLS